MGRSTRQICRPGCRGLCCQRRRHQRRKGQQCCQVLHRLLDGLRIAQPTEPVTQVCAVHRATAASAPALLVQLISGRSSGLCKSRKSDTADGRGSAQHELSRKPEALISRVRSARLSSRSVWNAGCQGKLAPRVTMGPALRRRPALRAWHIVRGTSTCSPVRGPEIAQKTRAVGAGAHAQRPAVTHCAACIAQHLADQPASPRSATLLPAETSLPALV